MMLSVKILLACSLCVGAVLSSPLANQAYEIFDEVDSDAEIIDAAQPLPGTNNLHEKRLPVIRLTIPAGYLGLYGTKNLGERSQLPFSQMLLPGIRNLDEKKALPDSVVARITSEHAYNARHPKSEVEKVLL